MDRHFGPNFKKGIQESMDRQGSLFENSDQLRGPWNPASFFKNSDRLGGPWIPITIYQRLFHSLKNSQPQIYHRFYSIIG